MVSRVNRLSESLSAAMCVGGRRANTCACVIRTARLDRDARNQFLRYVFHELRVPLNTVSLSIDELCARENDEGFSMSSCELLHHASAQVTEKLMVSDSRSSISMSQLETSTNIINDTLLLARIEVGCA
jgi:signal transduction histidine kinase